MSGLLAGEVLFAEVLVTPTGISKGCGYISHLPCVFPWRSDSVSIFRIVEFASQEDAQRAIRELSEQPLLGRPVFIREVRTNFMLRTQVTHEGFRIERMSHASVPRLSQEK